MIHRILSCIPAQLTDFQEKLDWLESIAEKYKPHIMVLPQEYEGGAVMMPHRRDITFDELFPTLSKLCKKNNMALVIGVQERNSDGSNSSAIWFINEVGIYLGRLVKFALPRYDHITTHGFGNVTPEIDFDNRFKTFKLHNLETSAIFCWEVYSDILWAGLGILKPDIIFNLVKFGPNAWPKVEKIKGKQTVTGFGYGKWGETDDGGWINRLRMASTWQVKCPIVTSTNSWNLNPRCMPMAGTISEIDGQAAQDVWYPQKEDKLKEIPEKIIISEIDELKVRAALENKFIYKELTGEFPPYSLGRFTMMLKMNRIQSRLIRDTGKPITTKQIEKGFFN